MTDHIRIDGVALHDESRANCLTGSTITRHSGKVGGVHVYVRGDPGTSGYAAFAAIHVRLPSGVGYDVTLPEVCGKTPEAAAALLTKVLRALRGAFNQ